MDRWAEDVEMIGNHAIEEAILALCRERGPDKTICPSEAARMLMDDEAGWRSLMPAVRHAAMRLARQHLIDICQRGRVIDIAHVRGPIRLRLCR